MRTETFIFIALIAIAATTSIKVKFISAFAGMISLITALYVSFWQLEVFSSYVALIPHIPEGYERPTALLLSFFIFYMLIRGSISGVTACCNKNFDADTPVFPRKMEITASVLCGALKGLCAATLLFLTAVMLPVTAKVFPDSFSALKDNAERGIRIVSFVEDTVSFQPDFRDDRNRMIRRCLDNIDPEDEEFLSGKKEEAGR